MALIQGRPVGILGTGIKLPERVMTNKDFEKIVDTSDEWIVERSGIRERRIVSGVETNACLAAAASKDAMTDAGVTPDEIDMVMVGTNSPDTLFPGVGPVVQDMIGARRAGGMDIQAGCPGALYAMAAAAGGIASGIWEKVVVAGSEALSRLVDQTDRNTCVLFGDGAGACVLGPWREGTLRITHADMKADGSKADFITLPAGMAAEPATEETVRNRRHFVKMQGRELFKFVSKFFPDYLDNFCGSCGITSDEADLWIFHQANIRIIENVCRKMGVPMDKVVVNLDRYGNTSAASILIALHEARADGRIHAGQRVLISSFGAGMTFGAVLTES
ncbi:MAG: ketoacyl-ACP synthase III [Synergistaceae bacterium]|jgi:3-oxoacyl-[acyl-carrier-protein] synthase-3|nr:ketoacyl-ACP synthase III [Synergistaceae bacterium]